MKFPLFVREKDSDRIFKVNSIHELQYHVEKIDIENEEYEAWDRDGVPVKLKLQKPVWIELEAQSKAEPEQLRRAVQGFATSLKVELPESMSVEAAFDHIRAKRPRWRWLLRIILLLVSLPIAYLVGLYAERGTSLSLGNGLMEATPLTEARFLTAFCLTIIVVIVVGNMIINRCFR